MTNRTHYKQGRKGTDYRNLETWYGLEPKRYDNESDDSELLFAVKVTEESGIRKSELSWRQTLNPSDYHRPR